MTVLDNTNTHKSNTNKDDLFAAPLARVHDFVFDKHVVEVFPDMIKRSVPGYATILHMIGQLAQRYAQTDSRCYDLGCSLGAATLAMRHRICAADVKIIGIDNSTDMLERCQQVMQADSAEIPVELIAANIQDSPIENASVCVLNFTLQFVPLPQRQSLLQKIYDGMLPGGVLILSEKLDFKDKELASLMIDLHHNFKKANGYSDLEISQKRNAIENVLMPETLDAHNSRLNSVGFKHVELWFQCFNFASIVAIK